MRRGVGVPLHHQCRALGLPEPVAEYRFHETRKWRLDWAWPETRLALEVEGGFFVQGRHSRGGGAAKDMEKYNALAVRGWRLLRVTPRDVIQGIAVAWVQRAFDPRERIATVLFESDRQEVSA